MSEKWTSIIAVFCIVGIAGILISAVLPDREPEKTTSPVVAEYSETESVSKTSSDVTSSAVEMPDSRKDVIEQTAADAGAGSLAGSTSDGYYYRALGDEEKNVYNQIFQSLKDREEAVLDTMDEEMVDKVFQCVVNDYPEIFYCSSYKIVKQLRNQEVVRVTFIPNFYMTEEEQLANQRKIDDYVKQCMEGLPAGADEYEKVKYVYEYIIKNTTYVLNSANNQNICSVFIGGQSVCQGYAKATQYILTRMGIEITLAYGKVDNEFHSWNLVRVDGEYYYMDPTWGDAGYVRPQQEQSMGQPQSVNYEYFLITTQQLTRTHQIDNVVPLPACIATRNNYYVREGMYFTSFDEELLKSVFEREETATDGYATFMCADNQLYQEMKNRLITEQEIFSYVRSSNSVSYSYNDELYTLIFWIE